ncbi:MAG: biopolymer transporter ExbB [Pseudomonadota bacterium]
MRAAESERAPSAMRAHARFTRPTSRIVSMLLFLGVVGGVGFLLARDILTVFDANPELNALIGFVFVVGVLTAFWQVFGLFGAVRWTEALARGDKGIRSVAPPSLLVAMDPMRQRGADQAMGAATVRSMLDSVSSRLDENRDILRYIAGLLIFLGLLGTFWGLSKTVPAVVDTIRSIAPQENETGVVVFDRLMSGLEDQLGGMGTAFSSSLLGLAGSLIVGFLELMAAGAQNRFFSDLETWLSRRTRITGVTEEGGMSAGAGGGDLAEQMAYTSQQMEALNRVIAAGEDRRTADSARIAEAVQSIERIAAQAMAERETIAQAISAQSRLLTAVERLAETGGSGGGGMDAETRRHIRNIDVLLARLIEEAASGRQDTTDALRREMRAVVRAMHEPSSER